MPSKLSKENQIKPPRGLMPRKLHDQARFSELLEAVQRYHDVNKPIPNSWLEEMQEINNRWHPDE